MVSEARLAAASQLATPSGPIPAGSLSAGDSVWAITPSGQLAPSKVLEVSSLVEQQRLKRLLTQIGDVLAPATASLASAQGPVAADKLRPAPRSLEFLKPAQLPAISDQPQPLEGLAGSSVALPQEVADLPALRRLLTRSGVEHELMVRGGWVAVRVERANGSAAWSWSDELDLLLALTRWPSDGKAATHRTRHDDRPLRSRLIQALMACGRNFNVQWTPGYFPVEARLELADDTQVAFAGVVAVQEQLGNAIDVVLEDAAAVIADLAYLRLRHH